MGRRPAAVADGSSSQAAARRGLSTPGKWIVGVSLALVIVMALAALCELVLRLVIPGVIVSNVREQLNLAPDHPVEVTLEGSALLPALTGHVGPASLVVNDVVVFDGVSANLRASAKAVPFNPTAGNLDDAHVSISVPSDSIGAIVGLATNGLVDSGEIRDGQLVVGRSFTLFSLEVPLTAALHLSVVQGDLLVEPFGVSAAGFDLTAEQLRPLLSAEASSLLDAHTVCVRDRLPLGVTLTGVQLSEGVLGGTRATVTADLDPGIFSNPAMQQPGVCE